MYLPIGEDRTVSYGPYGPWIRGAYKVSVVERKMIEELKSRNSTNQELIVSLKSQIDLQETQHNHALKQIQILQQETESLKSKVKMKNDQIHLSEKRIQICENGLSEVKDNLDTLAFEKEEMKESYEKEIEKKNDETDKLETKIEQQYDELETMISDLQSIRSVLTKKGEPSFGICVCTV